MIRVFVGTDGEIHHKAEKVLEYSIRKNTSTPVELTFMRPGWKTPPTGFSSHRYLIPKLCRYKGYAIYLDVDMIVLGDLNELWDYRTPGRWCVTSMTRDDVSVIDCSAFRDLPPPRLLKRKKGKHLARLMIGGRYMPNIPTEWNSIDKLTLETKLLHFSRLSTQPWHPDSNITYRQHDDPQAEALFFEYLEQANG